MVNSEDKQPTLYDVARYARVSDATVSRVVNGYQHVSAKTKRRVLEAIEALGYEPNRAAQTLATRRSYTIELITLFKMHYGPSHLMTSIERAAKRLGYKLIFSNVEDANAEDIQALADSLGSVDGVIIITPIQNALYDSLVELCRKPFVRVGGAKPGEQSPSIRIDQERGSQMATQHLIDLGHRSIGEICGPLDWYDAEARHRSFLATLQANHLQPGPISEGNWTVDSGYAAALDLLKLNQPFSALVVGNDQMALGAMYAFHEHGLRIPDDISIVGFDDIPEASFFQPSLTTIHQDFVELGTQSAEYLIEILQKPETTAQQRVLYPHLVQRQSTRTLY